MRFVIVISVMLFQMLACADARQPDAYWHSVISKSCMGSPWALGTDNIPMTDQAATTIVNIWAFQTSRGKPVAWLYKNESKQFWFQANSKSSGDIIKLHGTLPSDLYKRIVVPPKNASDGPNFAPALLSANDMRRLDTALRRQGIVREGCFHGDLPSSYAKSYVPGTARPIK